MARSPLLSSSTLTPFGGGGGGFGAFSIVNPGREAYLKFLKVKIDWDQGNVSNAEYLAAYEVYVGSQKAGSTTRLEAEQSLRDTRYRLERNDLLAEVENGTKTWDDLLAYDRTKLAGLNHESQEYLSRLDLYHQTQQRAYSDAAEEQQTLYQEGKLTTAQLRSWFLAQGQDVSYADNPELSDNIAKQVRSLDDRLTSEADNEVIGDFNDGKMTVDSFLTYATAARTRYASGTKEAENWDDLISGAKDQAVEQSLTYRYGLSQQYIQLQKFVKDNEDMLARASGGGTSTSRRIVLGADGQWKTVESSKSSPYAPSLAEQAAMRQRRIELADAKDQLLEVTNKIVGSGGFADTNTMIGFYTQKQGSYVKGSPEWYQAQERLDSLQQQLHQESVLGQEGVRVTFGGVAPAAPPASPSAGRATATTASSAARSTGATSTTTGGSPVTLDGFLAAIAHTESGGRYDAVNKQTGAYGKYQIMPSNWAGWATKYLGNANAPMSAENQEKVARAKMQDLYTWLGSWDKVAHWWLTGNSDDPGKWSVSSKSYVDKIMAQLGQPPVGVRAGTILAGGNVASPTGPLEVVTEVRRNQEAVVESRGRIAPKAEIRTTRARFPTNLDGSAFTKFYSGFVSAFKNGATTFTDYSSGQAVTYSIPEDLAARANMMNSLDDTRISYYATRAEVYSGTPSEFAASSEYSNAIKDKADNAYTILVTQQKGGQVVPIGGQTPILDPIAQGLTVLDRAKEYAERQKKLAQDAWDRGDATGAWAHIQLAEKTIAETQQKIEKVYVPLASQTMSDIQTATGQAAPESIAKAFADLTDWSTKLDPSLNDLDKLTGEVYKWAALDAKGHPSFGRDGTLKLHDGAAAFISPDGKIAFKEVPSAGYAPDGKSIPAIPGYVPIRANLDGTVPQIPVYAKWETGVVGYTASGVPIMGKVVSGFLNGKRYTLVEDPFHPGKWNLGMLNIKTPAGFSVVPGAAEGSTVYQITSTGKGGVTGTYRFSWNQAMGTYDIIKQGDIFGGDQILPMGDADTQALIGKLGLGIDLSKIATGDRWQYNMSTPYAGFTKDGLDRFLNPPSQKMPQRTEAPRSRPPIISSTLIESPEERRVASRAPKLDVPAPRPTTGGLSLEDRDAWYKDQSTRIADIPPIKATPPPVMNISGSPDDRAAKPISVVPIAPLKPMAPARRILATPMIESPEEQRVAARTRAPLKPVVRPKPLSKISNRAL